MLIGNNHIHSKDLQNHKHPLFLEKLTRRIESVAQNRRCNPELEWPELPGTVPPCADAIRVSANGSGGSR